MVFAQGNAGDEEAPEGSGLLKKLGVELGPIGLSLQGSEKKNADEPGRKSKGLEKLAEDAGISLGPIALSLGESVDSGAKESGADKPQASVSEVTVADWESKHMDAEGAVSLWMEDDFNAPSRLPGGRNFDGRENVTWFGEEKSDDEVPVHQVQVTDKRSGQVVTISAPEDRYVLFEGEEQGLELPYACRQGCCTECAVKVKSGTLYQPQALGVSKKLREQGYALLCVSYALSDAEVELQDPDEVYQMQFGEAFEKQALKKDASTVSRDDYALEIANMDE